MGGTGWQGDGQGKYLLVKQVLNEYLDWSEANHAEHPQAGAGLDPELRR